MSMNRENASLLNPLIGDSPKRTRERINTVIAYMDSAASSTLSKRATVGLYYVSTCIAGANKFEIEIQRRK